MLYACGHVCAAQCAGDFAGTTGPDEDNGSTNDVEEPYVGIYSSSGYLRSNVPDQYSPVSLWPSFNGCVRANEACMVCTIATMPSLKHVQAMLAHVESSLTHGHSP